MNREEQELNDALELLREAHREPIAEAHYAAVRARVLGQLEARRPWRGWIWVSGLAALLLLGIKVGPTPWSAAGPPAGLSGAATGSSRSPNGAAKGPSADQRGGPTFVVTAGGNAGIAAGHGPILRRHAAAAGYRVTGPPALQAPLVVKVVTNDPNVVIYWISGE